MTQHRPPTPQDIVLDGALSVQAAYQVAAGYTHPILSHAARDRARASHDRMRKALEERRHIYGLTTGFGPLANRLVDPADGVTLQQNLVHHLASGVGPALGWVEARAIVLARLNTILQGVSGASDRSIEALLALLCSDLAPVIPARGTVGASGDLTPLAHMVLCFQGWAPFMTSYGSEIPGPQALARLGLEPLDLSERDGLALVNGTSAMTGIALCNSDRVARLMAWSVALSAGLAECMGARAEAWDPSFAQVRPHPGQTAVVQALHKRLRGTTRLEERAIALRQLGADEIETEAKIGQDAYTLRCVPQVLGAVQDAMTWHDQTVTIELNAATDNPIFPETGEVAALHGGNFMGQHVALASDSLAVAICAMAGLAERQVARLTDERLNGGLPAFLHRGPAGLNSGLMGAQVTATALLAEMRSQGPASLHSISTNGANQDVVSMGTIAARGAHRQIRRTAEILAILSLGVAQAMDILTARDQARFSTAAQGLHGQIRAHSPAIEEDRPLGGEITALAQVILQDDPLA